LSCKQRFRLNEYLLVGCEELLALIRLRNLNTACHPSAGAAISFKQAFSQRLCRDKTFVAWGKPSA
jgi:hypothetical protein